jgi:hypothetical protein
VRVDLEKAMREGRQQERAAKKVYERARADLEKAMQDTYKARRSAAAV